MTKITKKQAYTNAGRAYLRTFLDAARKHGTIYYTIPHVARTGMSRRIQLITVAKGGILRLWPGGLPDLDCPALDSDAMDVIARDWGFSYKHRAFVIGGCGMDMVFALIDDLADRAYGYKGKEDYANAVRRESLG